MRRLVKHFDFVNCDSLAEADWNIQVGDKWANSELQHYVNTPKNLFFNNGLVIRATFDSGIYNSCRINTRDKFFFKYGRIDIVAKVPKGKGTWPALWMMSQENKYGNWPKSGEIDIMEHVGRNENQVFLCLHTETYNHRNSEQYYFETKVENATDEFHKYSIDWDEQGITYYIDDDLIVKYNKADKADSSHKGWPFDQEFFLIINLAIGGKFGGEVADSIFPADFIIKDIKVFQ
ncbi:glycoside hydrolase family 16 protein [Mycoplasmatota bacterium WC30]